MNIRLIVGLPASGKTHRAKALEAEGWTIVDDPKSLDEIHGLPQEGRVVITDPALCRTETRTQAEHVLRQRFPHATIEWEFFENNPEACLHNLQHRQRQGDHTLASTIRWMSRIYNPPHDQPLLPVHNPKG